MERLVFIDFCIKATVNNYFIRKNINIKKQERQDIIMMHKKKRRVFQTKTMVSIIALFIVSMTGLAFQPSDPEVNERGKEDDYSKKVISTQSSFGNYPPMLSISFDENFNGVNAAGHSFLGKPIKKPVLTKGLFGNALKSGELTGFIEYSGNVLNTRSGTVEMWISPVDWQSNDEDQNYHHVFFDAKGEGTLTMYKYSVMKCLLMQANAYVTDSEKVDSAPRVPMEFMPYPINWNAGKWYHIAGTWSSRGVKIYVNGKAYFDKPIQTDLPRGKISEFIIGDQAWGTRRKSSTLIDEVKIYDRELTAPYIAAHYKGDYDFVAPLDVTSARFDFKIDPDKKVIQPCLNIGVNNINDADLRVECVIVSDGQKNAVKAVELEINNGMATGSIAIPVPGKYNLIAKVFLKGGKAFVKR